MQAGPTNEPQPALYDPVLNITYPLNLTSPDSIPAHDADPVVYPVPLANHVRLTCTLCGSYDSYRGTSTLVSR